MNKKTVTTNGLTIPLALQAILSFSIIAVSIYLTSHFYESHFPEGLQSLSDSLCSGTGFWGCNKATMSSLGHIFYIPTSYFGIVIGVIGLIGVFFPSQSLESNNKLIFSLNALGCLGLLLYSLIVLKGLCQFCTLYYLLSFALWFLYFKYSDLKMSPDLRWVSGLFIGALLLPGLYMNSYYKGKKDKENSLSKQYIKQFQELKDLGRPEWESPFKIHKTATRFNEAPVRISIFSDFQCPFCKVVSDQIPGILRGFEDFISIQYYFYPLDMNCNPKVKRGMHPYACQAAYLAACDPQKFHKVHDEIFARQNELSTKTLQTIAKQFELKNCFDNQGIKDMVQKTMEAAEQYNVKSTPTIIINGKKIEGSIPTPHLRAIIKSLIKDKA